MRSLFRRLYRKWFSRSDAAGLEHSELHMSMRPRSQEADLQRKPKYIYRYCSADRAIQILRDKYLYLCPFDRLNDLFEASVGSAMGFSAKAAHELEIRRMIGFGGLSRSEAEDFVRRHTTPEEERENFTYFTDRLREVNDKARKYSGVVCFSAKFNDQRMWAQYGDDHAGVCLQFWEDEGRSVVHKHAQRVNYTNESRTDALVNRLDERGALSPVTLGSLFYLTKISHWEAEEEWRIIMLADSEQGEEARKFHFPASNIRRIFLGPRIAQDKRSEIHKIGNEHLEDWAVIQIQCDPETGISSFHGIERLKHPDDFEWHEQYALPSN